MGSPRANLEGACFSTPIGWTLKKKFSPNDLKQIGWCFGGWEFDHFQTLWSVDWAAVRISGSLARNFPPPLSGAPDVHLLPHHRVQERGQHLPECRGGQGGVDDEDEPHDLRVHGLCWDRGLAWVRCRENIRKKEGEGNYRFWAVFSGLGQAVTCPVGHSEQKQKVEMNEKIKKRIMFFLKKPFNFMQLFVGPAEKWLKLCSTNANNFTQWHGEKLLFKM